MARESFVFYKSFYEAIKELPRDVQGEVYTAIMEYSLYGITTEQLKPIARSIFLLIKPQLDASIKRYQNGKLGGRPKEDKETTNNQTITKQEPKPNLTLTKQEPNVNVNANVNDLEPKTLVLEKLQKESFPPLPEKQTAFEQFWKAYPRKTAQAQALKAWQKIKKDLPPIDELVAIIERQKAWSTFANSKYIPHPATWLNGGRWLDEEPPQLLPQSRGTPPQQQSTVAKVKDNLRGTAEIMAQMIKESGGKQIEYNRL